MIHREWASAVREADPTFFDRLKNQQTPEFLWIGCSDSRVPVRGEEGAQAAFTTSSRSREHSRVSLTTARTTYTLPTPHPPLPPPKANQILGLGPGEVFVHRNVGNQALHTDMNLMSCLEYAVKALKVGSFWGGDEGLVKQFHSNRGGNKHPVYSPSPT
jgi:carbonic anhydrase